MPHAGGGLQQQPVRELARPLLRVLRHLGRQPQTQRLVRVHAPHARERSSVVGAERGLHLTGAACAAAEQHGASADNPVVRRQAHEQRDASDGPSQHAHHRNASLPDTSSWPSPLPASSVPTLSSTTRSDGAAVAVSAARPQQTRCSSAAPAPHPTVLIRTTDAPSLVVSHSGGGTSSGGGGIGGTSALQHRSSHSNPTAAQRSVIRVSSASICSQLPTKSTSPSRSAVGASSESPVQKARSHAAAESRRRAATLTTPGSTPRRTSGKPKVASACEIENALSECGAQPKANSTSRGKAAALLGRPFCIFNVLSERAEAREEHPAAARCAVAYDHAGQRRACEPVVQLGESGQAVEEGTLQAGSGGGVATQAEMLGVGTAEDRQDAVGPGGQRRAATT
eukprot:scaffold52497_cov69-Phaeocystis_antarctica.AAC.2